jgi:hypothetical protein
VVADKLDLWTLPRAGDVILADRRRERRVATGDNFRTWFDGRWHDGEVMIMRAADHGSWLGFHRFRQRNQTVRQNVAFPYLTLIVVDPTPVIESRLRRGPTAAATSPLRLMTAGTPPPRPRSDR